MKHPWTWRRVNRAVHRDAGYLVAGLTLLYAISGVAVNHRADWNPSWSIAPETLRFDPLPVTDRDTMAAALVTSLRLPGPPRASFRRAPEKIELYYEGWTVEADVTAGVATMTRPRERPVLRGRTGLAGRGKWLAMAGLLPAIAFLLMRR
jgi:hypothetical protein